MKPVLVCLHGWGGSQESFQELRAALKNDDIEILTPDLPGFGEEPEPSILWTVDDYANWTETWISQNLKLANLPVLRSQNEGGKPETITLGFLGHSHGGRIALTLAARKSLPINHLYLCAAAGIRRPRHFKRIIGLILAKTGKFFLSIPGIRKLEPLGKTLLYKLVRVHDYEKASPIMRQTLINVTKEDLRPLLPQIHTPTDIFWGEDDGMTPVADAHVIHAGIQGSHLHLYPGVRHRVHRDRASEIAAVIRSTLAS